MNERVIAHVDMDAFFAAIEQRDDPKLLGKPVIVGADPKKGKGRGVVSTCSYEARAFGVCSAMPISVAYRKCPHATFLPPDMEKYCRVSEDVYGIFYEFTPQVEGVSIDEAFLDMTQTYALFAATPYQACGQLKLRIKNKTGLTASVGAAPVKIAAKIASGFSKPDGLVYVTQEQLLDFLWPLDVGKIWGLGGKARTELHKIGIETIGDLAKTKVRLLTDLFGKSGFLFWQLANGIDESRVDGSGRAKSISSELTFPQDLKDRGKIESAVLVLCEEVSQRLRQEGFKARTFTLKIRLHDFKTYTRSITVNQPANFVEVINDSVKKLYDKFEFKAVPVRLVGVRATNLSETDFPDSLFKDGLYEKKENVHEAVDRIKKKFGDSSIFRAGRLTF